MIAELEPLDEPPSSLSEALPQGQSFERGLFNLVQGEAALGPAGLIEPPIEAAPPPPPPPAPATPVPANPAAAHPAGADLSSDNGPEGNGGPSVTASGLTRRVPRKDAEYEGIDRYHKAPTGPSVLATKRSPDDVRAMLARYRGGLQRGRTGDEPTKPESGSD